MLQSSWLNNALVYSRGRNECMCTLYALNNGSLCRPLCKETLLFILTPASLAPSFSSSKWPVACILATVCKQSTILPHPDADSHYNCHCNFLMPPAMVTEFSLNYGQLVPRIVKTMSHKTNAWTTIAMGTTTTTTLMAHHGSCDIDTNGCCCLANYDSLWRLMIGVDYCMANEPEQQSAINSRQRTINADSWIYWLLCCLHASTNHLLTCITWTFIFIDNIDRDQCDHCHLDVTRCTRYTYFIWYS